MTTTFLHLQLTEDTDNPLFFNWRKTLDGNNNVEKGEQLSNMQIIDKAIQDLDTAIKNVAKSITDALEDEY